MTDTADIRARFRRAGRWTSAAALCCVLALAGCGGDPATPEAEVRALIDRTAEAAGEGDARAVIDALHPDYRDMRGNDREAIARLLRLQLLRGGSLVVFPTVEQVQVHGDDAATALLTVRFADADFRRLSVDGGVRRIEMELVRDDGWRVISARWARPDEELR